MSQQSRMEPPQQKQLEQMSDAELSAELDRALSELQSAIGGEEMAMEQGTQATPMQEPASAAPAQPTGGQMLATIPPEDLQQATAKMVAMGLVDKATSELTPELLMAFQTVIDAIDPGLFDLQQPEQLKEFINGVNSGAIDLAIAVNRARELAGQQPIATGAGVPVGASAGFVPGGIFGGPQPGPAAPAAGIGSPAGSPRPV
jgi:hypothetical protein